MLIKQLRFYSGDDSGGGGKNTGTGSENSGNTDDKGGGAGDNGGGGTNEKTFTQADIDRLMATVRSEEKRKFEQAKKDADAEAARKEAEKQGEFKVLYDTTLAELTSVKERVKVLENYEARINTNIDNEVKKWPEEVRKLDPGSTNVQARMDWLENSRPLAERLLALSQAPAGEFGQGGAGNGSNPPKSYGEAARNYVTERYKVPDSLKK